MNMPVRRILQYVAIASTLSIVLYYVPDYSLLEKLTADNSAAVLNWIGIPARSWIMGSRAFVNQFEIERMCTGVQVTAVFAGILLPFPKISWRRKAGAIGIVAALVYSANIGRIALEVLLLYNGILPWSLAHYPTGLVLGVFSVAFLVILLDRFIPEIGDYAIEAAEMLLPTRADEASLS